MPLARFHLLFPILIAAMEWCWIFTAITLFGDHRPYGSTPVSWMLPAYALSYAWNLFRDRIRLKRWDLLSDTAAFLLFLLLAIKVRFFTEHGLLDLNWVADYLRRIADWRHLPTPPLTLTLGLGLMWFLGRRLSRVEVRFPALLSEFQFGLAILLILFYIGGLLGIGIQRLVPIGLLYFLPALMGAALSHAQPESFTPGSRYGGTRSALLILSIILVLAAGLWIGLLLKPEVLKLALDFLKLLWHYAMELLMRIVDFIVGLFPSAQPEPAGPIGPIGPPDMGEPKWGRLLRIPEPVRKVSGFIIVTLWMILILAALWSVSSQILSWLRQRFGPSQGTEIETLSGAFREDLLALLNFFLSGISVCFRWVKRLLGISRDQGKPQKEMDPVRRIYRRLLETAHSSGRSRKPFQTPLEFLETLVEWLPEAKGKMIFITHQYSRVRYGRLETPQEVLEQMEADLARIRAMQSRNGRRAGRLKGE